MGRVKRLIEIPEKLLFEILELPILGVKQVNRLFKLLLPTEERKSSEKILHYLRIYTHLVTALDKIDSRRYKRGFDIVKIVNNLLKTTHYKEEEIYYKKMQDVINQVLAQRKNLRKMLIDEPTSDPLAIKTNLLLAQNICILRILKISK